MPTRRRYKAGEPERARLHYALPHGRVATLCPNVQPPTGKETDAGRIPFSAGLYAGIMADPRHRSKTRRAGVCSSW